MGRTSYLDGSLAPSAFLAPPASVAGKLAADWSQCVMARGA